MSVSSPDCPRRSRPCLLRMASHNSFSSRHSRRSYHTGNDDSRSQAMRSVGSLDFLSLIQGVFAGKHGRNGSLARSDNPSLVRELIWAVGNSVGARDQIALADWQRTHGEPGQQFFLSRRLQGSRKGIAVRRYARKPRPPL